MIDEQVSVVRDADAPSARPVSSFGAVLASERERLGISVADMASRLRLHPKQLVAIETEDLASLPAGPFVRGFVRNYAKELRIDATPLLAQLGERLAPRVADATDAGNGAGPRSGNGSDRLPRAVVITVAVGALVVFGLIGVMSSRDASQGAADPTGAAASGTAASPAAGKPAGVSAPGGSGADVTPTPVPAPGSPISSTSSPTSPASPTEPSRTDATGTSGAAGAGSPGAPGTGSPATGAASATGTSGPGSPQSTAADGGAAKGAGDAKKATAGVGSTAPAMPSAQSSAAAPAGSAPAAQAAAASPSKPAVVRSVRFVFGEAAWVRVEDGEGKVLLSQVNEAGTEQRVTGKTPLRLIIGNASSVTVDVSGREIDLRTRTSPDNVARLTVD